MCLLLLNLFLVADVLINKGSLTVKGYAALPEMQRLFGELPQIPNPDAVSPGDFKGVTLNDRGILPAVWWSRNTIWEPLFSLLFRRVNLLQNNTNALMVLLSSAVVLAMLRTLVITRASGRSMQTALDVSFRLRRTLHRQTLRLEPGNLEHPKNELANELFTTDIEQVRTGVFAWVDRMTKCPFQLFLLFLLALSVHWRVALQCLIPLGACWYLIECHRQRSAKALRLAQDRTNSELKLLSESLHKTRLVRGYGMEVFEHENFQTHLDRFKKMLATMKRNEIASQFGIRFLTLLFVSTVFLVVSSRVLKSNGDFSASVAILLGSTILCMVRPLDQMSKVRELREEASHSADRIYRYLNQIPEVGQAVGAKFLEPISKSLRFESVTYELPDGKQKLLDQFELKLEAGNSYSIVSRDPLEARAVAYILPRFIEPQSGRVLIDGEDISWATLESLRAEVIYVGGNDPFFTGTVFENISCGHPGFSLQDVTDAAKETHAHNFILKLPQGYETVLGEHGEQLDAGQAFRLGLARAVLRNPALLIIEEPTISLDEDNKSMLDDAYQRILPGRTTLFLPTRLSTLKRSDQIVFLHQGKVDALGKHNQLLKDSGLYRHWEYIRFNVFRNEAPELV